MCSLSCCSQLLDFEIAADESSEGLCTDGRDNDLDGRPDCQDPSCACDRCGTPFAAHPRDGLGVICTRDCQCSEGQLCAEVRVNGDGARCIDRPSVADERFDVRFVVETGEDGASDPRTHAQLVVGTGSQSELGTIEFDQLRWGLLDLMVVGQRLGDDDQRNALALQTVPAFEIGAPGQTVRAQLFDDLDVASSGRQVLQAVVGPASEAGGALMITPRATVASSTLSYARGEGDDRRFVRGRLSGRLRRTTSFDEARFSACPAQTAYDPDGARCVTRQKLRDQAGGLIILGCPVSDDAPLSAGETRYQWRRPWDGLADEGDQGNCLARKVEGVFEVRAVSSARSTSPWMLELSIPEGAINYGNTVCFGDAGVHATVVRLPRGTRLERFFELDLDDLDTDREEWAGRLYVDLIDQTSDPRFFAWMDGTSCDR
jgi:hypothetical protein